jgi:CubicO group peptidase (beta-lactamase class C family)
MYRLNADEQKQLDFHTRSAPNQIGNVNVMRPGSTPMPLARSKTSAAIAWSFNGNSYTIDDYLARHPVAALLIAKDGEILYERYQFGVNAQTRYLGNSMAKSFVGIAMGFAQAEGKIQSFDVATQSYVPELKDTAYGETTLRNLMRMGSGVKYRENYLSGDDSTKFRDASRSLGMIGAAKLFNEREAPQGSRFNYASVETSLVGAALKSATGEGIASFLQPRLWQAIGAEGDALWQLDRTGLEWGQCCLFAQPRDYLRLGIVLANDGARPDTGKQVIPKQYLVDTTDWRKADDPFQPKRTNIGYSSYGYHNFFWLQGGDARRFILLGIHGQAVFVDATNKLVMVHLAANGKANVSGTAMGSERAALWRGVVQRYGAR